MPERENFEPANNAEIMLTMGVAPDYKMPADIVATETEARSLNNERLV